MTLAAIAFLSVSMSTDAFAAAVGRGASHRPPLLSAIRSGAVFGVIEAITPVIGWALGMVAAGFVASVDHWIAFALLAGVGGLMIFHAVRGDDDDGEALPAKAGPLALIATAIGTSIDAAAVGVSLAFIGANIWVIAAAIGFSTFVFTTIGMLIGAKVGARFGRFAEIGGGIVLIAIGSIILVEHLGLIG